MFHLGETVKIKDEPWVNPAIRAKEGIFDGAAGAGVIVIIEDHYWHVDPNCLHEPPKEDHVGDV